MRAVLEDAIEERDDLRDAVERFIEKGEFYMRRLVTFMGANNRRTNLVEVSDGFHTMPRSSMSARKLLGKQPHYLYVSWRRIITDCEGSLLDIDPLTFEAVNFSESGTDGDSLNVQGLIRSLQLSLAREREEHRKTWQDAASQVGRGLINRHTNCLPRPPHAPGLYSDCCSSGPGFKKGRTPGISFDRR
jgi:hypothetical protein